MKASSPNVPLKAFGDRNGTASLVEACLKLKVKIGTKETSIFSSKTSLEATLI